MKKDVRRRLAYITASALVVAMFGTAVWLSRPEPGLLERATVVGPIDEDKLTRTWLSDTELVIVTTDEEVDGRNQWQGRAERWNVLSGEHTSLPGLNALFKRKNISPVGMPFFEGVSSDFHRLVWNNEYSCRATAHLDGSHYREWTLNPQEDGYFLDDRLWIERSFGTKFETTRVIDLDDRSKDREYLSNTPAGEALLAQYAARNPLDVIVNMVTKKGGIDIETYRTVEMLSWEDSDSSVSSRMHPAPLMKSFVQLPPWTIPFDFNFGQVEISPHKQSILYHLHRIQTNPLLTWLHHILPTVSEGSIDMDSLWVSKVDGKEFHQIGCVIIPKDKDWDVESLSKVEWLPGDKRIAFVHHHILYTVPVDAPR